MTSTTLRVSKLMFAVLCTRVAAQEPTGPPVIAITRVAIIDTKGGPTQWDMTVIVQEGRISVIAKNRKIPAGARLVDGRGKYLIPGLWDMHVHSLNPEWITTFFPLFIASGVTGVRDMARPLGDFELFKQRWEKEIIAGTRVGPRVVAAGPSIDGPKQLFPYLSVKTEVEGREAVRMLKEHGVNFIKVYNALARDVYFAIADESKKQGLPFVGHIPNAVSAGEASDAGQKSIEHLFGVILACSAQEVALRMEAIEAMMRPNGPNSHNVMVKAERKGLESYDSRKASELVSKFARNHTWQVPTLVLLHNYAVFDDPGFVPYGRLKFVTPERQARWEDARLASIKDTFRGDFPTRRRMFQRQLALVGELHRAGVPIMAGTDMPGTYLVPGFALHDELELLIQAGFTPLEAIQSATLNPARFLDRTDSLGTVEVGKIADLVLLDDDPLNDIRNTQKIEAVVAGGRLFDRRELDRLLKHIAVAAGR